MKLLQKITFLFAIIALSAQTSFAAGINFQNLSLEEGLEKAKKENKIVFIDVFATWCGPCKYLSANVFVDDDLGAFMNEHFVSLKIDGEKGDGLQLMNDFNLDSYPTMLFLNPEMDLLKKIVGAVGADEIQSIGNEVLHPETTLIYQLTQRYEKGERERDFLAEYTVEVLNNDGDVDPVLEEFLKLYPEPNIKDENEFIVFCLGVTDVDHASMKAFLNDLTELSEVHGEFVITKLNMTFLGIVNKAVESKNAAILQDDLNKIYPFYADFEDPEAVVDKEELLQMMEELYEEEVAK